MNQNGLAIFAILVYVMKKAKKDFGFEATVGLERGLGDTLSYFKEIKYSIMSETYFLITMTVWNFIVFVYMDMISYPL